MRAAPGMKVGRIEDDPLLRGDARYLNDLRLGQAHIVFVRSTVASARLRRIDTSAAARAPGVIAVATAGQLDLPLRRARHVAHRRRRDGRCSRAMSCVSSANPSSSSLPKP